MKRLNLKLLIGLLAAVVVIAGTAYGLWMYQMKRNSVNFLYWAEQAEKKGDVEEQVGFLRRYLLYDPHDVKVMNKYAMVVSEVARGPKATPARMSVAIQSCAAALREPGNDKNVEVRKTLADLYMRIGRAQDAISHLNRLLKDEPNDTKALKMLAQCQRVLGNDRPAAKTEGAESEGGDAAKTASAEASGQSAEELFRRVIEIDPHDIDAYGAIAEIYQEGDDDKDKEALNNILNAMVEANPDKWQSYLRRYEFRARGGINEEARHDLDHAVKLAPTELQVLLTAAGRASEDKDFEKARQFLDEAKKNHPKAEQVYVAYSQVERYAGRMEEAAKQLEEGLKLHPDSVTMNWMLAEYRLREGRVQETRQIVNKLEDLHLPPDRIEFLYALIMMQEKKYTEAINVLNRIRPGLANVPGFGNQIDQNRALCYRLLGQTDQEIGVYRQMLLADPLSRAARVELSRALISSGQIEAAMQELGELVEAGDENAERMMFQALLAKNLALPVEKRNWTATDELIKRIVQRQPDNGGLFALQIGYLAKKGDYDQAQQLLDKNREKFGKEPLYWLAHTDLANARDGSDAAMKVVEQAEQALGKKPEFTSARISLLAQKGDDASKKKLAETAGQISELPEAEQRAVLMAVGQAFYVLRDFEQAKGIYRELANRSKNDLNVQLLVFSLMRDAQDDSGMQAALDEIQRINGESGSYTLFCKAARIVNEVQNKNLPTDALAEADALADKASAQRPNWGAVWRLRGEIEERRGNGDKAIEDFRKSVELGDTNPGMIRHLAALLLQKQRVEDLQAIVDKLPNGNELLGPRLQAVLDIMQGNIADAVPVAREAVKEDSESYVTWLWFGDVLKTAGQFEEAEKAYKRGTELAPDVPDGWLNLARLYIAEDRGSEIEGIIKQIETSVKPEQRELALATVQEIAGNQEESEKGYLEALDKNPGDLRTLELVASYYFRRGNKEKAVEYLNRLSEVGKQAAPDQKIYVQRAHRALAELAAATKDPRDLINAIQIINRNADPDLSTEDKSLQAKYFAQLGDLNARRKSEQLVKEVLEKEPERGGDRLLLADLQERDGRWREAKETMLGLLTSPKHKKNPVVLVQYVAMLLRHDEAGEAGPYMDELAKLHYDKDPVYIAVKASLLKEKHQTAEAIDLVRSQIIRPLAPSSVGQLKQAGDQLVALAKNSPEADQYLAEAEKMYREYVEEAPENMLVLAVFLGQHRSLDASFEVCSRAIADKVPVEQVAHTGLAVLRGKPEQMTEKLLSTEEGWLKQSLDKDPDSIPLHLLLADFYDLKGDYDNAIATYRKIKDRSDLTGLSKVTVLNNLAFILASRNKGADEALPLIEEAIKQYGQASELLDTRGIVQLARGKTREALDDLQRAVESAPTPVKLFHLALAQLAANDRTAAADTFDRAQNAGLTAAGVPALEREKFEKLQREFPSPSSAARS